MPIHSLMSERFKLQNLLKACLIWREILKTREKVEVIYPYDEWVNFSCISIVSSNWWQLMIIQPEKHCYELIHLTLKITLCDNTAPSFCLTSEFQSANSTNNYMVWKWSQRLCTETDYINKTVWKGDTPVWPHLQHGVTVGIRNMGFQTSKVSFVVMSEVKVFQTKLRILHLDSSVFLWYSDKWIFTWKKWYSWLSSEHIWWNKEIFIYIVVYNSSFQFLPVYPVIDIVSA